MAVDRGGLNYNIKVANEFSANIKKFRAEISSARADWKAFRDELAAGAGTKNANASKLRREALSDIKKQSAALTEQRKAGTKFAKQEEQELKQRVRDVKEFNKLRSGTAQKTLKDEANSSRKTASAARDAAKAETDAWAKSRANLVELRKELQSTQKTKAKSDKQAEALWKRQRARLEQVRSAAVSAQKTEAKALDNQARRLQALSKQETDRGKEFQNIRKTMLADEKANAKAVNDRANGLRAETQARLRAGREAFVNTQKQNRALERQIGQRRRSLKSQKAIARQQRLVTRSVKETGSAVNRVSFTFRRLFGILAAFTAARLGVQGFGNLIRGAIDFNRQVEDSRISIAGLIVATGKVTDAQGRSLQGAEKFAAAQKEAARQTALLRQDALATVATFQEISKAFTAGVGPGLEAGLNLDEVRRTTVLVSQAAGALGLAQNQLIEEIRSLLRGTIQARTTLVASVLGITNEDIRKAKEAGNLFEFLQSRLQGFKLAAAETQNTVTGLAARIRDAFGFVTGLAAVPFFSEIKETLRDVFNTLVNIRRNGKGVIEKITPNQKVLNAFSLLFEGMRKFTASLRAGIENIDFAPLGAGIGAIFAALGEIDFSVILRQTFALAAALGEILGAAITATSTIVTALAPLAQIVGALSPILSILLQVKIFMGGIAFVTKEIVVLMSVMPIHLTKAGAAAAAAATKLTLMQRATTVMNLALIGLALSASTLINIFGNVNLTISQGVTLMASSFVNVLNTLILKSRILGLRLKEALGLDKPLIDERGALESVRIFFSRYGRAWNAAALEIVGATDMAEGLKKGLAEELLTDDAIREAAGANSAIQKEVDRLRAKIVESKLLLGQQMQDILDRNATTTADMKKQAEDLRKLLEKGFTVTGIKRATEPTDAEKQAQLVQLGKLVIMQRQVGVQQQILELQQSGFNLADIALVKEDGKLAVMQEQFRFARLLLDAKIEEQKKIVDQVKGTKRFSFENIKLGILEEQRLTLLEQQTAEIEEQARATEKLRLIAEGSMFEGFGAGIRGFAEQMATSFQIGVDLMKNAIQSFSAFVSQSIVDAFDPTKDTDLLENFARFLQQLAQMIIQQLVQLAIARAVLGLGIGSGFANMGFDKGGEVPDKKAKGPRPKGISKADTVRAWLSPGEFVQKVSAVKKYGTDVMDAINSGIVDPAALRALALKGQMRRMAVRAKRSAGFDMGGLVGAGAATARASAPAKSKEKTMPAPLFFGQQQMERFLGGGGGVALMRWLRDNQEEVSISINANRS